MNRDHFRILLVDLETGQGGIEIIPGREAVVGGSGLAALLFSKYGRIDQPWDHPQQPLIFAIGPLTGYFPLMSKTVCAFRSPCHNQYTESHAGGRSALALRFSDADALVITGQAAAPCFLDVSPQQLTVNDADFIWGLDVQESGRLLRRLVAGSGHRSILRIGRAGERLCSMANINADTYRHFGRMGGGAVMGAKRLKAIVIRGNGSFSLPRGREYSRLFKEVYRQVTADGKMKKYHDLGTTVNLEALNTLQSLPWRNLQTTADPAAKKISGQRFADKTLLRNSACAGCPVGCIHVGHIRERFMNDHRFLYRQVAYDYEAIFSLGTMLGITEPTEVLTLLDAIEQEGLDVLSAGVALAWATEANDRGLISETETRERLHFGNTEGFCRATVHLSRADNHFYALLGKGTLRAAEEFGGTEFACVLGQEMAGYATGETFFASQSLSFRHSHLDTGAYRYDQSHDQQDVDGVVNFLLKDEADRALLNSMVGCLFARNIYTREMLGACLNVLGFTGIAAKLDTMGEALQRLRWQTRLATGYAPHSIVLPKRFYKVTTWKGPIDAAYLDALRLAYGQAIMALATATQPEESRHLSRPAASNGEDP